MTQVAGRLYVLSSTKLEREMLAHVLTSKLNLVVHSASGFGAIAVWEALRERPDMLIVDSDIAHGHVLDLVDMAPRLHPRVRILVLSGEIRSEALAPWRRTRIDGVASKHGGVEELGMAVAAIAAGKRYFSSDVLRVWADNGEAKRAALSPREAQLLPLLATGLTLREAANEMSIAYKTADCYRTSLFRKLGLRDRVDLARYAIRERLIAP